MLKERNKLSLIILSILIALSLILSLYSSGFSNNFALGENSDANDETEEEEPISSELKGKIEKGEREAERSKTKSHYGLKNMKGKEPLITAIPFSRAGETEVNAETALSVSTETAVFPTPPFVPGVVTWNDEDVLAPPSDASLDGEPDIIASRVIGTNLVAAYMDLSTGIVRCRLANTLNDAATWTDRGFMAVPGGTIFHSDPVLATNSKGHFIATCLAFDGDSSTVVMQISTNKGNRWGAASVVAGTTGVNIPKFYDKPWIASDSNSDSPFVDRTYMCYTLFDAPIGTSKIMVKRIQTPLDAGDGITLASGAKLTTDVVQGCNVAVGPDGEVAVAWYEALPTDLSTKGRIMLSRSYDGGETWTAPRTVASLTKIPPCSVGFFGCLDGIAGPFRVNQFPDIAWDRSGGLHITFVSMSSTTLADVKYVTSLDCDISAAGQLPPCTFRRSITLTNDDSLSRDQFFPSIIASERAMSNGGFGFGNHEVNAVNEISGVVIIVAQDKREDPTNKSWRPWSYSCQFPVCTAPAKWDSQLAVSRALFSNASISLTFFVGDYNGLTSSTTRHAYAIWFDNVDGNRDIYIDRTRT